MKNHITIIILSMLLCGCSSVSKQSQSTITVSIEPISWVVKSLVDQKVEVKVLVPAGSSPETYEPTARQIEQLSNSTLYLSIGLLDFETELASRMGSVAPRTKLINLSDSVHLIAGTCSHAEHLGHAHGVDPHIWLSVRAMKKIIRQTAHQIIASGLDNSTDVDRRCDSLLSIVDSIDRYISAKATTARSFAIVHPSLSYFAEDYNLHQISLEIDGKEPSASTIRSIIDQIKKENISTIFYGIQTSDAVAKVVANEVGCSLTPFDPLPSDWPMAMITIADQIYGTN